MAKNRTPQTFEKRQRERDKQLKRQAKLAKRLERKASKREAKLLADGKAPPGPAATTDEGPPAEDAER